MSDRPAPLPWLNSYDGQTTQELIALKGRFGTGGILFAFELGLQAKEATGVTLTSAELVILAIEALEREVNNGGYSQLFFNSSVRFTPLFVESLRLIGCPKTAELTEEAIAVLQLSELTADAAERKMHEVEGLDKREAAFHAINQRFFRYDTGESIEDSLLYYIERNANQITLPA